MKQIQVFFIDNWKTTLWAVYSALLVLLLTNDVIGQDLFNLLLGAGVAAGFATSKDADTVKLEAEEKQKKRQYPNSLNFIILLSAMSFLFILSSCGGKGYAFTKYAVNTAFNVADDAGAFEARQWQISTQFKGDTIFYYKGINSYLITKKDTLYVIDLVPDRKAIEDTTLHYIRTLKKRDKKRDSNLE